jgi:uncharacterized damage-inducible protein DinB
MTSLYDYLKGRMAHAYRQLSRSLEGLSEEDARRGADPEWRRYRFGFGLDGSIAGIAWHVAAWKHVAADGLEGGTFPDVEAVLPHGFGWPGVLEWVESGQARLVRVVEERPPEELERLVTLEGQTMPVYELLAHMIEHDHYHTGQIYMLRQQMGHTWDGGT